MNTRTDRSLSRATYAAGFYPSPGREPEPPDLDGAVQDRTVSFSAAIREKTRYRPWIRRCLNLSQPADTRAVL